MSWAEQLQAWVMAQSGVTVYGSLALLLLGGVIGLPIPEDFPLILAGILIQLGKCDPLITFFVCYTTIVVGDVIIFTIGRWSGPSIFKLKWFSSRATKTKLKRVRVGIERRSILTVFLARHIFYIRTITFLSCGALNMSFARFLIADMIAALISVPLMLVVGYFAASHYDLAMQMINELKYLTLAAGLGILLWWLRKRRLSTENVSS
jgi:membrane protein DedA with SNARE-associated domain